MKLTRVRNLLAAFGVTAAALLGGCVAVATITADDASGDGDPSKYGLGDYQQRYSALSSINRETVKNLVPVWNLSLDNSANLSTQPIIVDGVMYISTHNATVAIDAMSGRQKWKRSLDLPANIGAMICCGQHARAVAVSDGTVFRGTLDAYLIAMSAEDGHILWRTKVADYKQGYSITGAPLVVGDVVITGMAGGEYHTRGFLRGYDAKTGRLLWTRYTSPSPGESGIETWNGTNGWKTAGGTTWITGSYDPQLDLVYWGTGNGAPWNPMMRAKGGDSLYICSVLAIRPRTGEIVWHFQFSPADPYDYDSVAEMVLADIDVAGQPTKVLMNANRNGYFYVLDRTNGKLLAANQYARKLNWASGIDMKTGRPIDTEMTQRFKTQEVMRYNEILWPSIIGAKNWQPMAFDPRRKLVYINGQNIGATLRNIKQDLKLPAMFFGADLVGWVEPEDGMRGVMTALDPLTGKKAWELPMPVPQWAGVLATGGNLIFTGNLFGEFLAYDSDTGKQLWRFQTGAGITSMPVTWQKDGKQYVTVLNGAGSLYNAMLADPKLPAIPPGGSVWTFALHGQ
ncbi:MAG: PQQ-dependent dehydrogenase, methanol/ethanol family [Burkholderiaceae bacterium]|jgi:alcohol dehydrogenase (cytochrome c)|nr:PQQ-dependent dehydrogenase, methanol/ethanol family [Burkholderiaceae bacterium]